MQVAKKQVIEVIVTMTKDEALLLLDLMTRQFKDWPIGKHYPASMIDLQDSLARTLEN